MVIFPRQHSSVWLSALVIVDKEKIDRKTLYRLEEAFAGHDLPFRVDVLDWRCISKSFRKVIEPAYKVI